MAKKKKKENPPFVESVFDGGPSPLDSLIGSFLKGGRGLGDVLIFAGKALKALHPRKSTDGVDQRGKPVQILMCETLLDGGTQDWAMMIDKTSLRFIVDHQLDSKTQGHLFTLSGTGRRKLEYGGKGEKQIADALQRWLDQFWSRPEQAVIGECGVPNPARVEGENPDECPYPWCAISAVKLIEQLQAPGRRKAK